MRSAAMPRFSSKIPGLFSYVILSALVSLWFNLEFIHPLPPLPGFVSGGRGDG